MATNTFIPDAASSPRQGVSSSHFIWALGSLCAFHRLTFSAELVLREYPPGDDGSHGAADLIRASRGLGLRIAPTELGSVHVTTTHPIHSTQPIKPITPTQLAKLHKDLSKITLPLLVQLRSPSGISLGLLTSMGAAAPGQGTSRATTPSGTQLANTQVVLFRAGSTQPDVISINVFAEAFAGLAWLTAPATEVATDPDTAAAQRPFNFKWFIPELLKHRSVWRDVLLASLALQLIALATPLFTQAIVDKVVVHRTQSTLIAIGLAMGIFMIFTALLSWVRQYLVLHTGNRVDAVLGQAVWEHLLKLPVSYFTHRPTGVVAARLHGVETIREFVSGAAVSLVLDLPFLFICLGVMIWYSVLLSSIAVGILLLIAIASLIMAPVFQRQLNDQFLLGARNQAFVTEHIGGFETVKTLQMEPQLKSRYASYLATYLQAGFKTKQVANTYNTFATTAEQAMTLLILIVGAYTVMTEPSFTVGMLIAFQMFASKLSQPVMRIVGLWSQFQQASLSVERLVDVMNSPIEPYSLTPSRAAQSHGALKIEALAFRYAQDRPLLYENLNLSVAPGKLIAIMGPSGTGKSTLAKLMLGFYQPTQGSISHRQSLAQRPKNLDI